MRKFRFFIVLLGLFAILGFSKTINAAGEVTINVTIKVDGEVQGTPTATTGTVGGTYNYNPTASGTFMFWTVNGVVRTDLPQNLSIKVTSRLDLVAHFASGEKYSVAFIDANTKLLGVNYVTSEGVLTPPDTNPSREGASFDGWVALNNYAGIGSLTPANPGDKGYLVAKYTVTATEEYTVTVDGTPLAEKYKLNDVVEVTSADANFSHWLCANTGEILSYSSTFKFTVLSENVKIRSVNTGAKTDPMVSIRNLFNYKVGYDAFVGHYELDETVYELIEVGFVHTIHGKHVAKSINATTNEFMVVIPNAANNNQGMKAYMTYKEIDGTTVTTTYNAADVVEIRTAADLHSMVQSSTSGVVYRLMNNIDLKGASWITPTDTKFRGVFDGQNYKISNLKTSGTGRMALFPYISGGTVRNLIIDSFDIESTSGRSGIVAAEIDSGEVTINNVIIKNSVVSGTASEGVGGVVGYVRLSGTVLNLTNVSLMNVEVNTTHKYAGGLVGRLRNGAVLNATDVYIKDVTTSTTGTSTDGGSAPLVAYMNETNATLNATRVVIDNFVGKGAATSSLVGFSQDNTNANFVDVYTYSNLEGTARSNAISRHQTPGTKFDLSDVYYTVTGLKTHTESQEHVLANAVTLEQLTETWWSTNFELGRLWIIPTTGIPILKFAELYVPEYFTVDILYETILGLENESITVLENRFILYDAPVVAGYEYIGLFTNPERTVAFNLETPVTNDLILYAKYEKVSTATVTFNTQGGPTVAPVTVNIDSTLEAFPEVANHEFEGVLKKVTGWTLNDEPFTLETLITGDITLVAVWEDITYTVSIDGVEQTVLHGVTLTEPSTPTHKAFPLVYTFKDWQSDGKLFDFVTTPITKDTVIVSTYTRDASVTKLEITNPQQLHFVIFEESAFTAELKNNIDLSTTEWSIPSEVKFTGTIDGKGFTISNLSYVGTGRIGLFPYLSGGTIINLVIDGFDIESTNERSGILAGESDNAVVSTVSNVVIKNSSVKGNKNEGVGGVVGYVRNSGTVLNLTNVALININVSTGQKYAGGLVGRLRNGAVLNATDVYIKDVTTSTTGTSTDGGSAPLVAYMNETNATLNATRVVIDNFVGKGAATSSLIGFSQDNTNANFVDVYTYSNLEGTARSNAISRHQTPGTTFDLSDVYYTVTGLKTHTESQEHVLANAVTLEQLTETWWSTNFTLGALWTVPATGIAVLTIAN